jgi:hypothetical protein
MILDDQPRAITQPLQCVLVGKSKVEPLQEGITTCWSSLPPVARRAKPMRGLRVSILGRRQIALDGLHKRSRIR